LSRAIFFHIQGARYAVVLMLTTNILQRRMWEKIACPSGGLKMSAFSIIFP
jgi:hypothetical protein